MFSTSTKIAFGYILLICLLFGAIGYIHQQMTLLTTPTGLEETISNRRKTTHQIVTQLYEAEIIGQTLRIGRLNEYPKYKRAMKEASALIDSLQQLLLIHCNRCVWIQYVHCCGIKSKTWYWYSKP